MGPLNASLFFLLNISSPARLTSSLLVSWLIKFLHNLILLGKKYESSHWNRLNVGSNVRKMSERKLMQTPSTGSQVSSSNLNAGGSVREQRAFAQRLNNRFGSVISHLACEMSLIESSGQIFLWGMTLQKNLPYLTILSQLFYKKYFI